MLRNNSQAEQLIKIRLIDFGRFSGAVLRYPFLDVGHHLGIHEVAVLFTHGRECVSFCFPSSAIGTVARLQIRTSAFKPKEYLVKPVLETRSLRV